jgi:hypothetical protein
VAGLQTSAATLLSLLAHHKRRLAWAQSVSGVEPFYIFDPVTGRADQEIERTYPFE